MPAARGHLHGIASPRLFIYDGQNKLVRDRRGRDLGREAVRFEYHYDEEDDDTCTIVFQSSDIYLADNKALQINSALYVTWGFMNSDGKRIMSPKRLIAIRDIESNYDSDKITLTLKCTDSVSYIKELQNNSVRETNFIDWLSEIVEGKYQANIIVHGTEVVNYNDVLPSMTSQTQHGNVTYVRESTAAPQTALFFETRVIKGQSKAIHKAMEDELKFAQGGPFFIDGRDNTITIHNRDFSQAASRSYDYGRGRGDIIRFQPKTFFQENDIANAQVASLEPGERQIHATTSDYIKISDITDDVDILTGNQEISKQQVQGYLDQLKGTMFERMANGNVIEVDSDEYNENLKLVPDLEYKETKVNHVNDKHGYDEIEGTLREVEAKDNTAAPFDWIEQFEISIPASTVLSSPAVLEELKIMLANEVIERQHKKFQCQLEIIGDPGIESSKIIIINGVAKLHSGAWYTVKVTHKLTPANGYTTELECIKKPTEIAQVQGTSITPLLESVQQMNEKNSVLGTQGREVIEQRYYKDGYQPLLLPASDEELLQKAINEGYATEGEFDLKFQNIEVPERSSDNDVPSGKNGNNTTDGNSYDWLLQPPNSEDN